MKKYSSRVLKNLHMKSQKMTGFEPTNGLLSTLWNKLNVFQTQAAITCLKLIIETLEQDVKYVQS